jgi:pilus assembly protein Flp/PilA
MNLHGLQTLRTLHHDESGQNLIEYALVASLIAFGAITTISSLSTNIKSIFSSLGSIIGNAH